MVRTGMAAGPPPAPSSLIPPGLPGRLARPQRPANSGAFVPASAREPCGNASPQGHRHRAGGQVLLAVAPAAHLPAPQRRGAAACPDPQPWVGGRWGGVRHRAQCPRQEGAAGAGCAVTAQRVAAAGADSALPGVLQSLGRGPGGLGGLGGCSGQGMRAHPRAVPVPPMWGHGDARGGRGLVLVAAWDRRWLRGEAEGAAHGEAAAGGCSVGAVLLAPCALSRPVPTAPCCPLRCARHGQGWGHPGLGTTTGGVSPAPCPLHGAAEGAALRGDLHAGGRLLPRCRVPASPCPAGGAWGLPGGDPALGSGAAAEVTRCWR